MRKVTSEALQLKGKPGETPETDATKIRKYIVQCLDDTTFWKTPQCLPAIVGASQAWLLVYLIDQQIYWLGPNSPRKMAVFPCKTKDIRLFTGLSDGTISTCLKDLEQAGFIKTRVAGLPPVRYVQVRMTVVLDKVAAYQKEVQDEFNRRADEKEKRNIEINNNAISELLETQELARINPEQVYPELLDQEKGTVTSYRDEGQNPPSSGHSYSANHLAVNQALNATRSNTNTPANSRQRKPRRPPAPLPSHPAIPFMQELARTLAPVLASPAHAEYPSEGATAFKYHTDALEAYDAIQTGAIMARTIDRPERYTDLTIWGNDFRLAQLKQWAKDPKAMESALLSAARIFATSRAKNTTVAKLPTVAAFLFGSTTSGGFLPWWSAIKPVEAMEAKEKQILKEAELEESSKPRLLELEEKNRIAQGSYYHEMFIKLFGREPKQFKEIK